LRDDVSLVTSYVKHRGHEVAKSETTLGQRRCEP